MNSNHLGYLDNLAKLRAFYRSIIDLMSHSNDIYELIYLEKLMEFSIPEGKLDFETFKKVDEKIKELSLKMANFECSNEEKRDEEYNKEFELLNLRVNQFDQYSSFLLNETKIKAAPTYQQVRTPEYPNMEKLDPIIANELIDQSLSDIQSSVLEYKKKILSI